MRSEVQKILADLEQVKPNTEELFQKFRGAARGDRKLACAIYGFRTEPDRDLYLRYLLTRIRPAVTELILQGDVHSLAAMEPYGVYTREMTDYFLEQAIREGGQEAMIWLLQLKKRCYGFSDRSFSLI